MSQGYRAGTFLGFRMRWISSVDVHRTQYQSSVPPYPQPTHALIAPQGNMEADAGSSPSPGGRGEVLTHGNSGGYTVVHAENEAKQLESWPQKDGGDVADVFSCSLDIAS